MWSILEMYHEMLFAGGHVNWEIFGGQPITAEFLQMSQHLSQVPSDTSATVIQSPEFP